ncbi:MAG TPA: hypothetical protein PKA00_13105 [Saprospiraceae bacterium]|nr:hypothetical protein [Saprospiraceae bacterium]HMQ83846.1 hypothetical protein [Saprospiraceae bacterium]
MKPIYAIQALFLVGVCLLNWAAWHHPFFWDTIQLGAKHAHWYYENQFAHLLLPDEIDSGHPPFFGMLLAGVWLIFGKSLLVSHAMMLPFLLGITLLLFRLGQYLTSREQAWILPVLVWADPVFLGQSVLVSPDIVLVFGFLCCLIGILEKRNSAILVGALILAAISTRGMMTVALLYVLDLIMQPDRRIQTLIQRAWPYVPSGLLALAFLIYHYQVKGWIGYHEASPWAYSFQKATGSELVKNGAILGWRMLDYGRIFIWLGLAFILFRHQLARLWSSAAGFRQMTVLFLLTIPALCSTFLLYKGLQGYRYLLPVFLSLTFVFVAALGHTHLPKLWKNAILGMAIIGLLTGNLWIYPDKISQGWDATLAHWPYYQLRQDMLHYLENEGIPLAEVGTAFPEIGPLKYKDLSEREDGLSEKDFNSSQYLLYSNVMNDYTDEEIDQLQTEDWQELRRKQKGGIKMILYKRN